MQGNSSIGKKIRRRRFQLFPGLAGMFICLLVCCEIITQLLVINKSDNESDSLEMSSDNVAVTQEVIDYIAGKHYVKGVFPVLYADVQISIGVYKYQGTVAGLNIAVLDGIDDEQIKLYKETVNPVIVLSESFLEGITTQDGASLSNSEKAVLRERIGESSIVLNIGEDYQMGAVAAGIINDVFAEEDAVYLEIDRLRDLLAQSEQESVIKNVRVLLRQRKYAVELEEEFQGLGYDVQYSYKEILEKNDWYREALYEQLKLIAVIVLFILLSMYYLLKIE